MSLFIPPPSATFTTPADVYHARQEHFAALRDAYQRRSDQQGLVNVAAFLLAAAWVVLGLWQGSLAFYALAVLFLIGFMASYSYHARLDEQRRRYAELVAQNAEGVQRLARDWRTLPMPKYPPAPVDHPIATDLDLAGHAGLLHLLNTAHTPAGLATLQNWILYPAAPEIVAERQLATQDLAPRVDFRDALQLAGRLMGDVQRTYEGLLTWAEGKPILDPNGWLLWAARILPLVNVVLIILQVAGVTRYPLWLLGAVVGYALTMRYGKDIQDHITAVAERQNVFRAYAELFDLITAETFTAQALQRLKGQLAGEHAAGQQMRRLAAIMPLVQFQTMPLFIIIQSLIMWSFHVLWLLEWWQRISGKQARRWLAAVGDLEALAALATLAHDQPAWAYPALAAAIPPGIAARNLGHPLLPSATCTGNDVALGPPGTFLLVTGSNMSGKSTLLRAIGINVVLAQAGGPVCAAELTLSPMRLATSIRIQDSLEQGVSYFMAELQVLKAVVDAAQAQHDSRASVRSAKPRAGKVAVIPATCLFLLDEILHGTNTAERQIAARHIIQHLLALGALGAVSTHDLTLARSPELEATSTKVHFTEGFARVNGTPVMRFDYQLRPGLATSTNALKLMEIVGLPGLVDEESAISTTRADEYL